MFFMTLYVVISCF